MAIKKDLTKDERILKEYRRLKKIFKTLDENQLKIVTPLLERAAFLSVSLAELEEMINAEGYTEVYQNGKNQKGKKQSANVVTHIAMTKNLTAIVNKLCDLVPPTEKEDSKFDAFNKAFG